MKERPDWSRHALATALSLWACCSPLPSQAWTLYGKGTDACGKFTAAVDGMPLGQVIAMRTPRGTFLGEGAAYAQWIQGYISALNALNANGPNPIDVEWAKIDDWVRKWCVVNPDRKLEEAVGAFAVAHVNKD